MLWPRGLVWWSSQAVAKTFSQGLVQLGRRFGSLLVKVGGHGMEGSTITNIVIARNEKFTDPTHIVPADAPVILCEQFNCFHAQACLYVEESSRSMETEPVSFFWF